MHATRAVKSIAALYAAAILLVAPGLGCCGGLAKAVRVPAVFAHGAGAGLRLAPGRLPARPEAVAALTARPVRPASGAGPQAGPSPLIADAPAASARPELAGLGAVRSDIESGRDVAPRLDRLYELAGARGGADGSVVDPACGPSPRTRKPDAERAAPLFTPAQVNERLARVEARPRKQLRVIESGGLMYSIDRSGMPGDAQVIELQAPMALYHLTSGESADLFVREQRMISGDSPYTNALHAGAEMIYTNYLDLTGLFFTDRAIPAAERGYTGAAGMGAMIRVIVPAGLRILKLSSLQENIPFYLILMPPGRSFGLEIERI